MKAAQQFEITLNDEQLAAARESATKHNLSFTANAGTFHTDGVGGAYTVTSNGKDSNKITITINEHPLFVPVGLVERSITDLIRNAPPVPVQTTPTVPGAVPVVPAAPGTQLPAGYAEPNMEAINQVTPASVELRKRAEVHAHTPSGAVMTEHETTSPILPNDDEQKRIDADRIAAQSQAADRAAAINATEQARHDEEKHDERPAGS